MSCPDSCSRFMDVRHENHGREWYHFTCLPHQHQVRLPFDDHGRYAIVNVLSRTANRDPPAPNENKRIADQRTSTQSTHVGEERSPPIRQTNSPVSMS